MPLADPLPGAGDDDHDPALDAVTVGAAQL